MKKAVIAIVVVAVFLVIWRLMRAKSGPTGEPSSNADTTRLLASQIASLKTTLPGVPSSSGQKVTLANGAVVTVPPTFKQQYRFRPFGAKA